MLTNLKKIKSLKLEVDNTAVRESQINRLNELKENRNKEAVNKALQALTKSCKTEQGNLLTLAVDASRRRYSGRNFVCL